MEFIYKVLDKQKNVIYVGITNDIAKRMSAHKNSSAWYSVQEEIIFSVLPNRTIAKLYETYLINLLKPKYNKSEKIGHDVNGISFDKSLFVWEALKPTAEEVISITPICDILTLEFLESLEFSIVYTSYEKNGDISVFFMFNDVDLLDEFFAFNWYFRIGNIGAVNQYGLDTRFTVDNDYRVFVLRITAEFSSYSKVNINDWNSSIEKYKATIKFKENLWGGVNDIQKEIYRHKISDAISFSQYEGFKNSLKDSINAAQ